MYSLCVVALLRETHLKMITQSFRQGSEMSTIIISTQF